MATMMLSSPILRIKHHMDSHNTRYEDLSHPVDFIRVPDTSPLARITTPDAPEAREHKEKHGVEEDDDDNSGILLPNIRLSL